MQIVAAGQKEDEVLLSTLAVEVFAIQTMDQLLQLEAPWVLRGQILEAEDRSSLAAVVLANQALD